MALKEIFVEGHVFDPDNPFISVNFNDPIHEQKRITVWNMFEYFAKVEHGCCDRRHLCWPTETASFPARAQDSITSATAGAELSLSTTRGAERRQSLQKAPLLEALTAEFRTEAQ